MEQLTWTTPIKRGSEYKNLTSKSPVIYKTPVKQYERNSKYTPYHNNMSCVGVLPSHITPPSGLTKFIARNPFETDLTNKLHLSMISPTVFSKVSSSSQESPDFAWSVDELALIQPAKIEEFPMQQIHCMDAETELKAQAAIDQFFNENEIIPSPWEMKKKENKTKNKVDPIIEANSDSNLETCKSKKDGWSQTILTFPPELPSHVMEILKPYFTFTQEQNVENDDANSSNNSLRRKLFFNHEDYIDNEEDSSICLSPVKMDGSLALSSSPPQSGMLAHGAPLKHSPVGDCLHNTSQINMERLSSPNMSPIHSTVNNLSYENIESQPRLVAQLEFTTDMSIDQSSVQYKELSNNHSLGQPCNEVDIKMTEKKVNNYINLSSNSTHDSHTEIKVLTKDLSQNEKNLESTTSEFNLKYNAVNTVKYMTNSCKINTNENDVFQPTNGTLGISDQQNISNPVQDTGYQTYSMSSTANVTDSYNNTPIKQKVCWSDRIAITDDEFRISDWKENMKNIFSSTPSRSNREKDNHIF